MTESAEALQPLVRPRPGESDHFDGRRFFHPWAFEGQGMADILPFLGQWITGRDRGPWVDRLGEELSGAPPPARSEARVTWVGHATFLLQLDGVNLLCDPVWSLRCAPTQWAGPRRFRPPGIRFEDLPPIDAVLLSHNHYDHLDVPTLRRLRDRFGAPILAPLGHERVVRRHRLGELVELDWWQAHRIGDVVLTLAPAQHFSGRGPADRDRSLWGSWFVEGSRSLYFGGDSGLGPHYGMIHERLGPPDLALLGIGAFRPRDFMKPVHMDPADAIEAARALGAGLSIPHHYGTFSLGMDGMSEAADLLESLLTEGGPSFLRLEEGGAWSPPA